MCKFVELIVWYDIHLPFLGFVLDWDLTSSANYANVLLILMMGAYQLALSFKMYMQMPLDRKSIFNVGEHPKWQFENNSKPNTSASKGIKGNAITSELLQQDIKETNDLSVMIMVTSFARVLRGVYL